MFFEWPCAYVSSPGCVLWFRFEVREMGLDEAVHSLFISFLETAIWLLYGVVKSGCLSTTFHLTAQGPPDVLFADSYCVCIVVPSFLKDCQCKFIFVLIALACRLLLLRFSCSRFSFHQGIKDYSFFLDSIWSVLSRLSGGDRCPSHSR